MLNLRIPHVGPGTAESACLVLAGAVLVASVWHASRVLNAAHAAPALAKPAVATQRTAPAFDARAIVGMHVFGTADPVAAVPPEVDQDDGGGNAEDGDPAMMDASASDDVRELPATTLPLRLSGIIHTADAQASAILAGGAIKGHERFRAGDTITAGVTVHRVEPRGVVIRNRGRLERLELPRIEPDSPATALDVERREAALAARAR